MQHSVFYSPISLLHIETVVVSARFLLADDDTDPLSSLPQKLLSEPIVRKYERIRRAKEKDQRVRQERVLANVAMRTD